MQRRTMRDEQRAITKDMKERITKWYLSNGYSLINESTLENKQSGKRVFLTIN